MSLILVICRNPSLGFATKARACKVAGQESEPQSERKCDGMNPHTPKGTSTLGVRVPMDCKMSLHHPFGHSKHKLWPKERPEVKLVL
jgi:hypothetical protein